MHNLTIHIFSTHINTSTQSHLFLDYHNKPSQAPGGRDLEFDLANNLFSCAPFYMCHYTYFTFRTCGHKSDDCRVTTCEAKMELCYLEQTEAEFPCGLFDGHKARLNLRCQKVCTEEYRDGSCADCVDNTAASEKKIDV